MTFDEFRIVIKPLAVHFGAEKDQPTWMLYHAALMVSPAPSRQLLDAALPRAASSRKWFPTVQELRTDAEAERQALLKAHPHERCVECRNSTGWLTTFDEQGIPRVARCPCFERYRVALARLGVGESLVTVPMIEEATR